MLEFRMHRWFLLDKVSLGNYLLAELKKNILPVEVDGPCGWISASCRFQYYENISIYTPDKWVHLPKIMQPKTGRHAPTSGSSTDVACSQIALPFTNLHGWEGNEAIASTAH
nr:PREDICTED: uncharacterized protein LOC103972290 isoform X1 [Musa acuminata subsp. malaccensis]